MVVLGIASSVREVLEVCEKAEWACAELYHHFAALFKDDRDVFHLWLKAALEEENRAKLLALVGKLRHDNIIASVELELAEGEGMLQQVRARVEEVKEKAPSLREALEIAVELEIQLDRMMRENVIKFADASYDNSFLAITNSTQLELLQQACERLDRA